MVGLCARSVLIALVVALLAAQNAYATPVDLTVIGIWSENSGSGLPASGTDLAKGQKFVVKVSYDDATPLTETIVDGFTYYTVDLASGAAAPTGGGLTPNGSSLDVFVPLEGLDTVSPFVYSESELSHRDNFGDPFPSPVPQLHFSDAAGTDLLGFKLETFDASSPAPYFLQMQTEVATIDPGGGAPLVPAATGVAQMRTGAPGFEIIIRSLDAFVDSVPVQAEAGDDLSFSAIDLTRTTDGGTFRNVDGTWRDNDLGAGRTDKEDFLAHDWTLAGSVEGGASNTALVGADVDADRPVVLPSESPFVLQPPPGGTRAVENVNKRVDLVNSGLTTTTDVATWQVAVSEDLTGFSGGTDVTEVSYINSDVAINAAMATPVGDDLQITLDVEDADFAINALGLADFELLTYTLLLDGGAFVGLSELLTTGSQFLTLAQAAAAFGGGMHSLEIRVADRVRTVAGTYLTTTLNFTVVPEPGTGVLMLIGLAGLGLQRSSRDPSTRRRT